MNWRKTKLLTFALCAVAVGIAISVQVLSEAPAAQLPRWGVNGHSINNGHSLNQTVYTDIPIATQLDLVAELGAGWYRCGLSAVDLQTKPQRVEELVSEAEKRGIRLLPVLFPAAGFWDGSSSIEQIRTEAMTFAKEIVSRYKGRITHWELANELDNYASIRKGETNRSGKLWTWNEAPDGSSPDDYENSRYERVKAQIVGFFDGVKAADPSAVTVLDTAGWLHFGLIERLVNEDKVVPFDVLSWHWYSHMGEITNVQGQRNMVKFLKRYRRPLWITEINRHPNGDAKGQPVDMAHYIKTDIAKLGANSGVECLFIYELLDQPNLAEPEGSFGLVETVQDDAGKWQIKQKKPAFEAYKAVTKANP